MKLGTRATDWTCPSYVCLVHLWSSRSFLNTDEEFRSLWYYHCRLCFPHSLGICMQPMKHRCSIKTWVRSYSDITKYNLQMDKVEKVSSTFLLFSDRVACVLFICRTFTNGFYKCTHDQWIIWNYCQVSSCLWIFVTYCHYKAGATCICVTHWDECWVHLPSS